jgi:SpoVK/Ycf46/Vps4 family AAA+-type ATPase
MYDTNHQEIINDYIELYYNDYEEIKPLIKAIWDNAYTEIQCKKTNLYAIKQTMEGFVLTPQVIKNTEVDIDSNYNDDFKEADNVIKQFIAQPDEHGIVILNGAMGTGKTHYIRHLINTNPDKTFILGTKNIAEQIAEPSFIDFLSKNQNSILILEDCEKVLADRNGQASPIISTLLNLTDGFIGASIKPHFICTFNCSLSKIDKALLRKGRLSLKYEFEKLSLEKTKAIYPDAKEEMTLADAHNALKKNDYSKKKVKKIGFT